ncbi:hypothetical protein BD309DRAFT_1021809 [Dichomitus squalens]|uniref:Uncharacterized protein n=1 Tax=Dichomitus squalens TaxID=114155 RepID=A0A4Q9NJX1_9APHY|nr:hypothetical protein BD311DRAFT_808062 [Dichomitus squalens]TBU39911.1 hypothetical protein BD309DRAFT_1021809 [Dichomitus squalens]
MPRAGPAGRCKDETSSVAPSEADKLEDVRRHSVFYFDHIVFQVGTRLFKLPRRKFEGDSEVFRDMFTIPPGDNIAEGQSDEHPLMLESIQAEEFESLLQVMFRPHHAPTAEEAKELSRDGWVHVLKLTTMWGFEKLRRIAIDSLTPLLQKEDPVGWITLARTYEVYEWLLPALHALARRTKVLQPEEVEPLGIITVVKMAEVRESFPLADRNGNYYRGYATRETHDFISVIRRVFEEELRAAKPFESIDIGKVDYSWD